MHHLIYLSQATRPLSAKALTRLLDQARLANERQHLIGAWFMVTSASSSYWRANRPSWSKLMRVLSETRGISICAGLPTTPLQPVNLLTGPWLSRPSRRPSLPT
jgi:hypothetical protein